MSSKRIEEMKKERMKTYKTKSSQRGIALIILVAIILLFIGLSYYDLESSWIWIIGLLIGFTLQRSKFCFTAGFRDPIIVGSTNVMRAIVVALMIMTIAFGLIYSFNGEVPSELDPVGLNTSLGAVLFGIGMVIAGGCASGTLMRIGEGFKLQLVVLIGFIIGSSLAASSFETWDKLLMFNAKTIYIPDIIGMPASVVLQVMILTILYIGLKHFDEKNSMLVE